MRAFLMFACASLFVQRSISQKSVLLPRRGAEDISADGRIVPDKRNLPSRRQLLYAAEDLPAGPGLLREVAFWPVVPASTGLSYSEVELSLDVSMSPLLPEQRTRYFAKNLGREVVRVFNGKIVLPGLRSTMRMDWYFRVPFQRPVLVGPGLGKSLLLDFRTRAVESSAKWPWALKQWGKSTGSLAYQGIGYNCHYQRIFFLTQWIHGELSVGSRFDWRGAPLRFGAQGFLMVGARGYGTRFFGGRLPLDLKPWGAAGCTLEIEPLLFLPFGVNARLEGIVQGLSIPRDARFGNKQLFLQGAYSDPQANALGWLFLPSLRCHIGTGEGHHASSLAWGGALGNGWRNFPETGSWLLGDPVPRIRLSY